MKIDLSAVGVLSDFRKSWAVYIVHDAGSAAPLIVGMCRLSELFGMPDNKLPVDTAVILRILTICPDRGTAAQQQAIQARAHGVTITMATMSNAKIQCIETGDIYHNAAECAVSCEIDPTALSKHLRGKPGFKTVKGRTYRKVSS